MKKSLLFLLILISCQEETFDPASPSVDQFVSLLRNGEYGRSQPIPNFRPEQIPNLLRYASSTEKIESFPTNPISSAYHKEIRLGECLLWTIESIRIGYGEELSSPRRYPSLNPVLANTDSSPEQWQAATDEEVLQAVQAYTNWWNDARTFAEKRTTDPLENTSLAWR